MFYSVVYIIIVLSEDSCRREEESVRGIVPGNVAMRQGGRAILWQGMRAVIYGREGGIYCDREGRLLYVKV